MSNSLNCKSKQRFSGAVEGYLAEPGEGKGYSARQVTAAFNQDWQDAHILPSAAAAAADIRLRDCASLLSAEREGPHEEGRGMSHHWCLQCSHWPLY